MKRYAFNKAIIVSLVMIGISSAGYAQDQSTINRSQVPVIPTTADKAAQADDAVIHNLEILIDRSVKNIDNDDIGTVDDIIFDTETGKIIYVILSTGGFLGFFETYHVVPFSMLEVAPNQKYNMAKIKTDTLKEAPKYNVEDIGNLPLGSLDSTLFAYYGAEEVPVNNAVSWNKISDKSVVSANAEEVGSLTDLLFTKNDAEIQFFTLSIKNMDQSKPENLTARSVDEKQSDNQNTTEIKDKVIVPFKSIQLDASENSHIVLASKEKLLGGPSGYNEEGRLNANVNKPDWQKMIHDYYEVNSDAHNTYSKSLTASNIIGMKVKNAQGEEVGEIKDIQFDNSLEKIATLTISIGGFSGIGAKEFHIERDKLTYDKNTNTMIVNISDVEMSGNKK